MIIRELMDGIRKLDMVLPEFQREYVWTREQAKQLLVSLFRGYPTGSLLFWKTDNPPDIKNMAIPKDRIGTTQVILDGQQRLTTLYLFTQNTIPPYYREKDILDDPRSLFFDLETGEFQYYQASRMKNNSTWVPVTSCFTPDGVNPLEIAQQKGTDGGNPFQLAKTYYENLTRLRNILERDYPIQTVPPNALIDDAIDVFDRVNSLGTKLTDAELALAHICGKWPQAREIMKTKIAELESKSFYFDLTFATRCLVASCQGRALFETIHGTPETELKKGWEKVVRILDYLVTILPRHAFAHSTEDLTSTNVLVPAVMFLARNDCKFSDQASLRRFVHWMYAAATWGRYTGQTDTRLDHDISIVHRTDNPWTDLVNAIIDQRGRIEVKPSDLEGRGNQHPLFRMTYILSKANGAIDWFNGSPLDVTHGASYQIHSHHIFPQSVLYSEAGYSPENHLHKKIVNEIANRAFLTGTSNLGLADRSPAEYLPEIEKKYPGALQKQFVPLDPALWTLDRFEDFLQRRRELIANAINAYMKSLLGDLLPPKNQSLEELLAAGESAVLEFKSTLRWDLRLGQVNKDLQKAIAKTIAGMMNTEGGTLLIGVEDSGAICGIEHDCATLKRTDRDGFEQALTQTVADFLGAEYGPLTRIAFEKKEGKTVCIVQVEASPKPVFLSDKGAKEFYVRTGNTTRPLDTKATHEYINMHWEG